MLLFLDEDNLQISLPAKGSRPLLMGDDIGPDRRFRDPAEQAEVERRVAIYAEQIEQTGSITWLPPRGSGV